MRMTGWIGGLVAAALLSLPGLEARAYTPTSFEAFAAMGNQQRLALVAATARFTYRQAARGGNDAQARCLRDGYLVAPAPARGALAAALTEATASGSEQSVEHFVMEHMTTTCPEQPPNSDAVTPIIRAVGYDALNPPVTGSAPLTVHVHALDSLLDAGEPTTAYYRWDFGNPDGRFNTLDGFGGAHTYDEPGSYRIRLTIIDENREQSSVEVPVTVLPPTRRTLYVSAAGNDSNDGLSAATPIRSVGRLQQLIASDTTVRFRRGDHFDTATIPLELYNLDNVVVTHYGEGPLPLLVGSDVSSDGNPGHINVRGSNDVTVSGLHFSAPVPPTYEAPDLFKGVQISEGSRNVTVRNSRFDHVGFSVSAVNLPDFPNPTGIYLLDNVAELPGYYFYIGGGEDLTLAGNVSTGTRAGHSVRFYANRVFIHHNRLDTDEAHLAARRAAGHAPGTALSAAGGEYAYIAHNEFHNWIFIGYLAVDGLSVYTDAVVAGNHFVRCCDEDFFSIRLFPQVDDIMVRNNVFDGGQHGVYFEEPGAGTGQNAYTLHDVQVLNNTAFNDSDRFSFLNFMSVPEPGAEYLVANNLYVQPAFVGGGLDGWDPYMITSDVPLDRIRFSHNLWQRPAGGDPFRIQGTPVSMEAWRAAPQTEGEGFHDLTLAAFGTDYAPPHGSAAAGHAAPVVGVIADYHGNLRPADGPWTAGAVSVR